MSQVRNDPDKAGYSCLLQVNMFMHRQSGDNISKRKIRDRSNLFTNLSLNGHPRQITVGNFFKRKKQVHSRLRKSFSFEERKIHKTNLCLKSNDIKKAGRPY